MPGFSLEVPRPCTIIFFFTHTLRINYLTNTFLLVNSPIRSKQLSCFVYLVKAKKLDKSIHLHDQMGHFKKTPSARKQMLNILHSTSVTQ